MRTSTAKRMCVATLAGFFLAVGIAGTAGAQLDKTDQKCRDTVAKTFAKAVGAANKVGNSCHKGRLAGKVPAPTDCNDLSQADTKDKFLKAQTKLTDSVAKLCTTAGASDAVLDRYVSCPEPCATETAVGNPIASFTELGLCLACLAGDIVERRNADVLGSPSVPLPKPEEKCHGAIGKGYAKRLKTLLKSRSTCQKAQDALDNLDLQPCDTSDDGAKIAAATTKANDLITASCTGVNLTSVDSCADTSVGDLQTCLVSEDDAAGAEAFASSYELPPTACPVSLTITTHAGNGIGGSTSATRLDSGWNGLGHGQDLVDLFSYGWALTCPNSEPPCGTCTIDGFTDTGVQSGAFTRCREDTSMECDVPFGIDTDCPGLQECAVYVGPPLPLSAGNNPVCVVVKAAADVTGTTVVETGESEIDFDLRAVVHLGLSLTQPCPRCNADPVAQDGNPGGTCEGGTRHAMACDVQGFDATFGNTSLDCPRETGAGISGSGLVLDTTFGTDTSTMGFNVDCGFPLSGFACACRVCSGDTDIPCNSNADCTGIGTCTHNGGGTAPQPNGCDPLSCSAIGGSNQGECTTGPDNRFCDGVSRASGKGYIACLGNADCVAVDSVCGGDCGECETVERAPCFLDPIVAEGIADPDEPVIATTFCIPPTSSTGVNGATGLPGPSRALVQLGVTRNY